MFERFTDLARRAVVLAQESCRDLRHAQIGPEHLLLGAISCEGGIAHSVFVDLGVSPDQLKTLLTEIAPPGVRSPEGHLPFSTDAKKALESALREALALGHNYIGTEHIVLGLLRDERSSVKAILDRARLDVQVLRDAISDAIGRSSENYAAPGRSSDQAEGKEKNQRASVLDTYGKNLTKLAKEGKLDPVIGRHKEVKRIMQVLARRSKSNPCLVGDPGVGKTAVVEGLAQEIASGNVPAQLQDVQIYTIDMGALVAGSRYRGDFEERMKKLVKEVTSRSDVVIFLDEIHTVVGAGAAEGSIDASNMLKPALARGEMRVIGATTFDEYRKHIEKDPALERRFQPVQVDPPSLEHTLEILHGLRPALEKHHDCSFDDDALQAAVKLSDRYVSDRQMPDKAIDLIDEAGAYLSISPEEETSLTPEGKRRVTVSIVEKVCAQSSNVPVERVGTDDAERLLGMEEHLRLRVVGQDEALSSMSRSIRRARSGLGDPRRPLGSFLFLGPTGVGKTEAAKALAEFLFGSEEKLISLDMSEFQAAHDISKLLGAPPGYIGHDEPGQLTERVRRNPYSVILFDEVEKAHPDIFNTLLQVLEEGRITDAKGRTVDFKNTIVVMTSNLGSDRFGKAALGFAKVTDGVQRHDRETRESAKKFFKPELLNRLDELVVFAALQPAEIRTITSKFLEVLSKRLFSASSISLFVAPAALEFLATEGFDEMYGARPLRRTVQRLVEDPLSELLLTGLLQEGDVVRVDVADNVITVRPETAVRVAEATETSA